LLPDRIGGHRPGLIALELGEALALGGVEEDVVAPVHVVARDQIAPATEIERPLRGGAHFEPGGVLERLAGEVDRDSQRLCTRLALAPISHASLCSSSAGSILRVRRPVDEIALKCPALKPREYFAYSE